MLWPLLPQLLTIPSPFELRQAQEALKEEEIKGRDSEQLLQQFRQAQQALRESMMRLTAVVETAVDGFAQLLNKPGLGFDVNEQALNKYSEEVI